METRQRPYVEIYDTTLRDGTQQEGISLTAGEKLRVARLLDDLGVPYVEGGWPGANPKDDEFFARAVDELDLHTATLVAFGSTRRPRGGRRTTRSSTPCSPPAPGSSASSASRGTTTSSTPCDTSDEERWRWWPTRSPTSAPRGGGCSSTPSTSSTATAPTRVSRSVLDAAHEAGAERLVLCDTNGGTLPHQIEQMLTEVMASLPEATFGCHFHNDSRLAVASSLAAVRLGVLQVQGCVNGYGERTGNADLCSVIPNLALKMGYETIPDERMAKLTTVSHHIAELVNRSLDPHTPYVGVSAFTHKAGLHTSALARRPDAYEHMPPAAVGNTTRVVVSELAGRSTVPPRPRDLGLRALRRGRPGGGRPDQGAGARRLPVRGRRRLVRAAGAPGQGWKQAFFELESYKVFVEHRDGEVAGRGDGEADGGRRAAGHHQRGQRPGVGARPGTTGGAAPPGTPRWTGCGSPTTGCATSTRATARRPGCGCWSETQRR